MHTDQANDWQTWIGLQHVRRFGPKHVALLDEAFDGDLERAWNADRGQIAQVIGDRLADQLVTTRSSFDLQAVAAEVQRLGHLVVPFKDCRYPALLRETSAPPLVLYVLGDLVPEDASAVSVIGSRDSTPYGREVARGFGADLAAAGVTVVSGLARGIDGVAHRAALDNNGRTIAVLAGSLDWIYPSEHRGLARSITEHGALISEYPTRTRPVPGNFRARNRIMAGISTAVVIVEARLRSGTLITANYAAHYNRDVFAVPGSVLGEASEGCHQLLRDGASIARSAADVLADLGLGELPPRNAPEIDEAIGEVERTIIGRLTLEPTHIDDLAADLDLPITEVATALMMLELTGRVRNHGAQHFGRAR